VSNPILEAPNRAIADPLPAHFRRALNQSVEVPELLRRPTGYARYLADATPIQRATFVGFLDPGHQSGVANLSEVPIIL